MGNPLWLCVACGPLGEEARHREWCYSCKQEKVHFFPADELRGPDVPDAIYEYVYNRDNRRCRKCGKEEDLAGHHVVYRSRLGTHHPDNLVLLCWGCHRGVHDGKLLVKRIKGQWFFKEL